MRCQGKTGPEDTREAREEAGGIDEASGVHREERPQDGGNTVEDGEERTDEAQAERGERRPSQRRQGTPKIKEAHREG